MEVKNLSVFFPAFNEEGNIKQTVENAKKVLEELKLNWEIIVINDGSKDNTAEVVEELSKRDERIKLVNKENGGYGTALRAGFDNAKYEWIVYTDSDGQFDFSEVNKFIEVAKDVDATWGYRIKRKDPFYRLIFQKGWALSVFLVFGVWLKDIDCGFKMIKKEVIKKISPLESSRGGMINAELAIKIKRADFKITQVGVQHYPRVSGKPTGANLGVIIQSFIDLLKLRLKLK